MQSAEIDIAFTYFWYNPLESIDHDSPSRFCKHKPNYYLTTIPTSILSNRYKVSKVFDMDNSKTTKLTSRSIYSAS